MHAALTHITATMHVDIHCMNTGMQESCSYAGLKTLALCKGVNYFSIHAATSYTIVIYIYMGVLDLYLREVLHRIEYIQLHASTHYKSNRTMKTTFTTEYTLNFFDLYMPCTSLES